MATTIKVGHASISENSSANGQAGDQTGREVRIDNNFSIVGSFRPSVVLRPKVKAVASKSAIACEAGCNNSNIGYSQIYYGGRNSAEVEAKKVGYDLSKISAACNTDCSAFMTLCAVAGGASFNYYNSWGNAPVCSSMRSWFTQNDDYEALTDKQHLTLTDYLKRGDILVDEDSHTVMVLENGCQITESTGTKIVLTIKNIESTGISAAVSIIKIEDSGEKALTTDDAAELYKWEYYIKPLNEPSETYNSKKFELDKDSAEFSLTGLAPQQSYSIKVIAKELVSKAEIQSANIIFTTLQKYPTAIKNLTVKFDGMSSVNAKCNLSFDEPGSWGNTKYTNGYRIYLIVNGKSVGYSDTLIKPGSKKINKTVLLSAITKNSTFDYTDILQIGIQTWLKDSKGKIIFDSTALKCSQPMYNKHFLKIVDKVFLKVGKSFKQVLLYDK